MAGDSDNGSQQPDFNGLDVAVRSIVAPTRQGRSENQDNYLTVDAAGRARFLRDQQHSDRRLNDWPTGHRRFAILDGMGGHSYGREAAELTVEGLLAMPATDRLDELSAYLDRLHLELHAKMHSNGSEPGCTLTLLELPAQGPALLFHAGDSRLYEIGPEQARCLTIDHVPATKFALFGLVNETEWYRQAHETGGFQISQAFVLGNSLGSRELFGDVLDQGLFELHDDNLPPFLQGLGDRRPVELKPDHTYLLASDGLWHLTKPLEFIERWPQMLAGDDAAPLAERLEKVFEALIEATAAEPRLRGDNSTAIAFRLVARQR